MTRWRPALEIALDGLEGADAAADLAGNGDGAGDGNDDLLVERAAFAGAVEVDEVESRRAFGLPATGHGDGVVGEDGFAGVVALVEADAAAVADVDGGD